MKQTKITFNLKGLEDFQKAMGSGYRARIGIIGDKAQQAHVVEENTKAAGKTLSKGKFRGGDAGLTNAEIGVIQMFGSIANKIPPRDFLLFPIQHEQQDIVRQMRSSGAIKLAMATGNIKKVFQIMGVLAENAVQKAFESGGFGQWAPNKPSTIAAKGSSRQLINTAQLRRAVSSDVVKGGTKGAAA